MYGTPTTGSVGNYLLSINYLFKWIHILLLNSRIEYRYLDKFSSIFNLNLQILLLRYRNVALNVNSGRVCHSRCGCQGVVQGEDDFLFLNRYISYLVAKSFSSS